MYGREKETLKKSEGLTAPTKPNMDSIGNPFKPFSEQNPSTNGENKERILRKTTTLEIVEKPFSTQPKYYVKRGCNTVRSRSIFYVDQLRAMGYTYQLPLEEAKQLFSQILGIFDRTSLKAYFGTLPGQSTRKIRRYARYQSGTQSIKDIELTQDIKKTKGYLEKLNLVSYEKKGNTWFMIVENRVLVSQLMKVEEKSNDKISLTPITNGLSEHHIAMSLRDAPEGTLRENKTNNNLQSEREVLNSHEICLEAYSKHNAEEPDRSTPVIANQNLRVLAEHKDNPSAKTTIIPLILTHGKFKRDKSLWKCDGCDETEGGK